MAQFLVFLEYITLVLVVANTMCLLWTYWGLIWKSSLRKWKEVFPPKQYFLLPFSFWHVSNTFISKILELGFFLKKKKVLDFYNIWSRSKLQAIARSVRIENRSVFFFSLKNQALIRCITFLFLSIRQKK